jgi:hypothetical protein
VREKEREREREQAGRQTGTRKEGRESEECAGKKGSRRLGN